MTERKNLMGKVPGADSESDAPHVHTEKAPTFEEAMARLEQIVAELQTEDVPLEKAFALWEEGQRLHAHCTSILEGLKKRLEAIQQARNGADQEDNEEAYEED